ncbi:MAG: 1-deoxy-D-xylulose 5-phosphate reductoisomerase [candidate division Zixibacteria bacterium SM23_73_3]|nr:MAG: 1-deoxy-D-xylulose 5-phosphate reductoisomerase [candidate division Zixibacteria bacterium SM23_73_3]
MKNVVILGSTGSIGKNTLEVLSNFADRFSVLGLSANTNIRLLEEQIKRFRPKMAVVTDEESFQRFPQNYDTEILWGMDGLKRLASHPEVDLVINALVGSVGLLPSLETVKSGKNLAIANKESLVMAGELLIGKAKEKGREVLPIDSEHSAIQQCLLSGKKEEVGRLILTASGGPFLRKSREELKQITVKEALSHPIWEMGKKITIDSATLMNKGLEVIEAHWLFGIPSDRIEVMIHPQSIIHSMVEFVDGSVIAQMSLPNMKLPIQYALLYPQRVFSNNTSLDLTKTGQLTFLEPDTEKFPCLGLAYKALEMGGTAPAVLNAANEVAVEAFLACGIGFTDIQKIVQKTLKQHQVKLNPQLDDILNADKWARQTAKELCCESEIKR